MCIWKYQNSYLQVNTNMDIGQFHQGQGNTAIDNGKYSDVRPLTQVACIEGGVAWLACVSTP